MSLAKSLICSIHSARTQRLAQVALHTHRPNATPHGGVTAKSSRLETVRRPSSQDLAYRPMPFPLGLATHSCRFCRLSSGQCSAVISPQRTGRTNSGWHNGTISKDGRVPVPGAARTRLDRVRGSAGRPRRDRCCCRLRECACGSARPRRRPRGRQPRERPATRRRP
jgi:hypothetical protein